MKEGWEIKNLGEVIDVLDNLRKPITKKDRVEGKFPYYGATGILSYVDSYIFSEKLILIGEDGAKWQSGDNTSFIVDGKYWVNNHAHAIRPNRDIILDEWIVYFLNFSDLTPYITGMTVPKLNQEKMRSIQIPVPPLPEQQRIVSILDEAFAAIAKAKANAEQNLRNARELFESYLQGVFEKKGEGWDETKLGNIASFRNGMNFSKSGSGEKIKIVGVKDFKDNYWVPFDELDNVVLDGSLTEIDELKKDDIVAVRSNGNPLLIGRTLIANDIEEKTSHSGFTIRIRLNSPNIISPIYLCHYLKTQKTRKELVGKGIGIGIKSLNQGSLSSLTIPFPKKYDIQEEIILKIDALQNEVSELEEVYRKKIQNLEELRKSILQKAFSGEL